MKRTQLLDSHARITAATQKSLRLDLPRLNVMHYFSTCLAICWWSFWRGPQYLPVPRGPFLDVLFIPLQDSSVSATVCGKRNVWRMGLRECCKAERMTLEQDRLCKRSSTKNRTASWSLRYALKKGEQNEIDINERGNNNKEARWFKFKVVNEAEAAASGVVAELSATLHLVVTQRSCEKSEKTDKCRPQERSFFPLGDQGWKNITTPNLQTSAGVSRYGAFAELFNSSWDESSTLGLWKTEFLKSP
jgi:hypothetical protein